LYHQEIDGTFKNNLLTYVKTKNTFRLHPSRTHSSHSNPRNPSYHSIPLSFSSQSSSARDATRLADTALLKK
jgi:hypothetical protein